MATDQGRYAVLTRVTERDVRCFTTIKLNHRQITGNLTIGVRINEAATCIKIPGQCASTGALPRPRGNIQVKSSPKIIM